MIKTRSRPPSIASIDASWILATGEMQGYYVYRALPESIKWIGATKVLRFTLACVEGDDDDFEAQVLFGKGGIVLKYDLDDEVQAVPMQRFDGPSGVFLDYRSRTEIISILLRTKNGRADRGGKNKSS